MRLGWVSVVLTAAVVASCTSAPRSAAPAAEDPGGVPERFTIVPDDHHVPYAGTAGDGRRFFLSEELFRGRKGYVGLYLWKSDGTFDEVRVTQVDLADRRAADRVVAERLAELGDYELEPIDVEPFIERVDRVPFGWEVSELEGEVSVTVQPGDFIAYYAPFDGLEYDT